MSHKKVYSVGKVPFSWETTPGICKVNDGKENSKGVGHEALKLPPPQCPTESHKGLVQDIQIPLPPCPFQPPLKKGTRKGVGRKDPFLAAYKECTKNVAEGKFSKVSNKSMGHREGRGLSRFSCKHSCLVREDSLERMVHVSTPPSELSRSPSATHG